MTSSCINALQQSGSHSTGLHKSLRLVISVLAEASRETWSSSITQVSGGSRARAPTVKICLNFMQFLFWKIWQNGILASPGGRRPSTRGILNPPLCWIRKWLRQEKAKYVRQEIFSVEDLHSKTFFICMQFLVEFGQKLGLRSLSGLRSPRPVLWGNLATSV